MKIISSTKKYAEFDDSIVRNSPKIFKKGAFNIRKEDEIEVVAKAKSYTSDATSNSTDRYNVSSRATSKNSLKRNSQEFDTVKHANGLGSTYRNIRKNLKTRSKSRKSSEEKLKIQEKSKYQKK